MRRFLDRADRKRLEARFGARAERWCDELPALISHLEEKWEMTLSSRAGPGRTSCVWFCEARGQECILKLSPEASLGSQERDALDAWRASGRVPKVEKFDRESGALLMERVRPGTPLRDMKASPRPQDLVETVTDLHASVEDPDLTEFPSLGQRVEFIFSFWGAGIPESAARYDLTGELFNRSLALAKELATDSNRRRLLHGDLHPGNILCGGKRRGFVAVDPRPCVGDPTFDLIDIALFGVSDCAGLRDRVRQVAALYGAREVALWDWCACTAVLSVVNRSRDLQEDERSRFLLELAHTVNN